MPISTINTSSIADDAVTVPKVTDQVLTHRNLIINGAMQVAQRGTSTTNAANGNYTIDRFRFRKANTDNLAMNIDQVADAPTGLVNSLKMTVGTAETAIDADEYVMLTTSIEAQDMQVSAYGTADAKDLSLSFYVKSSVTGTYCVSLYGADFSTSPDRRYYSSTFTVNAANTWERKSVTISGNVNDAIANDNGEGLRIGFLVGAGTNYTSGSNNTWGDITNWAVGVSTNFLTTSSATFQITGVQLEVGDTATPFEHRSFGDELARCQRYFEKSYAYQTLIGSSTGTGAVSCDSGISSTGSRYFIFSANNFKVTKRTTPTLTIYSQDGVIDTISKYNSPSTKVTVDSVASRSDSSLGTYIQGATSDNSNPYNFHWVADAEL